MTSAAEAKAKTLQADYNALSATERSWRSSWVHGFMGMTIASLSELAHSVSEQFDLLDERLRLAQPPTLEDVRVEQDADDHRKLTRTETWSDGRKFVAHLRNDAPMFVGAYERTKTYSRGDWVVFGGSTWACMKTTSDSPGTNTQSWMVVARKGSDGQHRGV